MATSFATTIKPYFSQSERDAMMNPDHTGGFTIDLWSASDMQTHFALVKGQIDTESMPPGGWPSDKIKAFDADFESWQAGGYQP